MPRLRVPLLALGLALLVLAACARSDKPVADPAAASGAAGTGPATLADDAAEILHYRLTEQNVAQFITASRNLQQLARDSMLVRQLEAGSEDSSDAKNLDEMVAKLDRVPAAKQAIESAGISPRDYAVSTFALMGASMAYQRQREGLVKELPKTVNADNVQFFADHPDRLDRLKAALTPGEAVR